MRVIGGKAKKTKLNSPRTSAVRPTADRVKEALFNILGSRVCDSLFLDLYAGSGAIGIEALSRGAYRGIFVENKKTNIALIKENLLKCKLTEKAVLLQKDVGSALLNLAAEQTRADLIFMDPPYQGKEIPSVIESVKKLKILSPGGIIAIEHPYSNRDWADNYPGYRQKKYGRICLTFIELNK